MLARGCSTLCGRVCARWERRARACVLHGGEEAVGADLRVRDRVLVLHAEPAVGLLLLEIEVCIHNCLVCPRGVLLLLLLVPMLMLLLVPMLLLLLRVRLRVLQREGRVSRGLWVVVRFQGHRKPHPGLAALLRLCVCVL